MWVWVNSGSWWWTGGLACCNSWGRKESDTTKQLDWRTKQDDIIKYTGQAAIYQCHCNSHFRSGESKTDLGPKPSCEHTGQARLVRQEWADPSCRDLTVPWGASPSHFLEHAWQATTHRTDPGRCLFLWIKGFFSLWLTEHHLLKRTSYPTALQGHLSSPVYSLIMTTLLLILLKYSWFTVVLVPVCSKVNQLYIYIYISTPF